MAQIVKREGARGVRWRARVRVQGHPEQSRTFKRRTDAVTWANGLETDLDRDAASVPSKQARKRTLADAIGAYVSDVLPHKRHNKDRKKSAARLAWWSDNYGGLSLAAVSPELIESAKRALLKTRSPQTVDRYLSALSVALKYAHKGLRWITRSPLDDVTRFYADKGRDRYLSDAERTALLKACRESREPLLYPLVVLALSTGARQGELLCLTWPAVDLDAGTIRLTDTKNTETRVLPLVGHALDVISELPRDYPLVFPRANDPAKPVYIRKVWADAVTAAGIDNFRFHDLRHSAASYMAMGGATAPELAAVLGHKTLAMVKRYTHIADDHSRAVVAGMNARIFK